MNSRGVKIAVVMSVFAVVLMALAPMTHGWQEGQTWTYKWTGEWSKNVKSNMPNATITGTIKGKYVEAYLVRYEGKDSTGYKFHYEGGFYSYGYVNAAINGSSQWGKMNSNMKIEAKMIWIDFEGEFHLVKVNSSFTTGDAYYGIKDFSFHVYTKQPLDIFTNVTGKMNFFNHTMTLGMEMKLTGTMDISGAVVYKTPIPFLPADENFSSAQVFSTSATYSGHWKLNTQGYIKLWGNGMPGTGAGKNGTTKISLDKHINTDFSGTENYIDAVLIKKGNVINYPFMIGGLPTKLLDMVMPSKNTGDWHVTPLFSTSWNEYGKYSTKDCFYQSVNVSETNFIFGGEAAYSTVRGESQQTSVSDVKTVETNAPAEYGSYEEGMSEYMLLIILSIIVAVAVIVVVLVVRRKRVNGPPPSAAQPEQVQEQPPSDEILDEESP
ncbi:MAG: hypothetical protein GXO25_01050 [Euryarchaeota archaeon]|nr:hypothetical protein [Euryarchaeota archaeon]